MYSDILNDQIECQPKEHRAWLYRIEIQLKKQCNPESIEIRRVHPGEKYNWEYDFTVCFLRKYYPCFKELIIREDGWHMFVCHRAIIYELHFPILIFEEPILDDELNSQNENDIIEIDFRVELLWVRTISIDQTN